MVWYSHIQQNLSHGNAFLRLYGNDYNCNKSCLGTYISRLVPLLTQQQYILHRDIVWNLFSLANLVPKLTQDVCLGKGPNRPLTMLRYSFYLFSAATWEVYKIPLKLMRWILFLPPQTFCLLLGRSSLTSKGITVHPGIIDSDDKGEIQTMMSSQILWRSKRGTILPNYSFFLTCLLAPLMASGQVDLAVQIKNNPYGHQ